MSKRGQDRKMQKFRDVLCSWDRVRVSQLEAAELLRCSERQFRRYRDRLEEDGTAVLADRRLGKTPATAIAAAERDAMLPVYRGRHQGWTAKHFHDYGASHHGFAGATRGPRRSCIRRVFWIAPRAGGRIAASVKESRARA